MEETDNIIIANLQKLRCDIDEEITSLADFTTEIVIEGVVKCLLAIQPNLQLSHKTPPHLPARYKLCMEIAQACKDIGLKGDLGYETFLHGSQTEIRRLFLVLIQKLPKANEQPIADSTNDPFHDIFKLIQSEILSKIHQPWLPAFCKQSVCKQQLSFQTRRFTPSDNSKSKVSSLLSVIPSDQLIPSLIENHNLQLAMDKYEYKVSLNQTGRMKLKCDFIPEPHTSSKFSLLRSQLSENLNKPKGKPRLPPKPLHLTNVSKLEAHPTIEDDCQKLTAELEKIESEYSQRQNKLHEITDEIVQLKEIVESKEIQHTMQEKELDRQGKLHALLSEAPANLARIKKLLETNREKMALLEQEWLNIKNPLEDQYNETVQKLRNTESEKLKSTLENTISSLRQVVGEIRTKNDNEEALRMQLESLPPTLSTRTFYTQRILSIVANVKKQNDEMKRVLEDVKSVQREINTVQGKVERTFTVTDEIIFQMAKSDETAKHIYKYLISLHNDCSDILNLVKESGNLSREIKDLEEQVETEARKNVAKKIKRLQSDLEQIRCENRKIEQGLQN